jgi:23S rRNA (cytosine1962-C5)-methyltransferase
LALRMVAWGEEPWSPDTLRARLRRAAQRRAVLGLDSDAYRVVHAEGDGLPGLVIDRYGSWVVIEPFMSAWDEYLAEVASFMQGEFPLQGVLVRRGRRVEPLLGDLPGALVVVREGGWQLLADLTAGQKTGLFLDQRDNRRLIAALAKARAVLNLFSYSGGFGVAALLGGAARVVNVDSSAQALTLARLTYEANGLLAADDDFICGDAFAVAGELRAVGARFDLVIVDPPAFVTNRANLAAGLRGYREINRRALQLAAPQALLLTCSCSARVSEQLFAEALLTAALEAGRHLAVLERRGAGWDHPVSLFCPESRHLKAWLCCLD